MHIKGNYNWLKHLDFTIIDEILLIFLFTVTYQWKFQTNDWWQQDKWILLLIFICLLDALITFLVNLYDGVLHRSLNEDIVRYFLFTVYNVAVVCIAFYCLKVGALFSREMLFDMYSLHFALGLVIKSLWKKTLGTGKLQRKIPLYIVCEEGKEEEVSLNSLAEDLPKYVIVGSSNTDGFIDELKEKNAREVLIALKPGEICKDTYEQLIANGIGIHMNIESMIGFQTENQFLANVGVYRTLDVGTYSFTSRQLLYLGVKRIFDIICGAAGLVVLVPLTLVVKAASLCSGDQASIIYTQNRIGQYGKEMKIYKFRSMVPDAEERLAELLKDEKYQKEWEESQKLENDPRITKIGDFLRKTSLDELPQLLNVLRGEMSLVGPRPLVEGELEAHHGLKLYTQAKPGITGWWGCNGRSNIDYRERLELEYYYVKNCSLYLDILCILKTVLVVLKGEGSR